MLLPDWQEPLTASEAEEAGEPRAGTTWLGEGRPWSHTWRRAAQVAAGTFLALAAASLIAVRLRSQPASFNLGEAFELEAFSLLGSQISPLAAVKESFKKDILTVDGAFTGGKCLMEEDPHECPIANMTKDLLTGVFPGGDTRCLLGDTPYLFQVIPGDADKLLLYFQGGGACWNAATANAALCTRAVADEGRVGIFDRENAANPYKKYTIVILGYCSGDAHVGDADHEWSVVTSFSTGEAKQRGYVNARSAIDWVKKNLGDQQLESLIITGSSAGALGTQIWSRTLLQEFDYRDAAVIADSYAGIFPFGVQGSMMKNFGLCAHGLLSDGLNFLCKTGTIDLQEIFRETIVSYPEVAFANLDSRIDFVQIAFFKIVHKSLKGYGDHVGPKDFSSMMQNIYRQYNGYANWVSYSVNSGQHMYLNNDVLYQTTPVGNQITSDHGIASKVLEFSGNAISGDDTPLVKWLAEFPVTKGRSVETHCAGVEPKTTTLPPPPPPSTGLFGMFSQHMNSMARTVKGAAKTVMKPAVSKVASTLGFEAKCSSAEIGKMFYHS